MEFCEDRVFTALNADELRAGDKVLGAYCIADLKEQVKNGDTEVIEIINIETEDWADRFKASDGLAYSLAYLVERKENCTNCSGHCELSAHPELDRCKSYKPKTEQKAEKKYRPFKDTDELIKVWREKSKQVHSDYSLTMPYIWVRRKGDPKDKGVLITGFGFKAISIGIEGNSMQDLFNDYIFLDGSPCGVEE